MIREANNEDIPRMVEIYLAEKSKPPYNDSSMTTESASDKLKKGLKENFFSFVAVDGKVVGFVVAEKLKWHYGEVLFFHQLFVDEKFQGKGFGTALVKKIEEKCRELGLEEVYLQTHKRAKSLDFYKSKGYNINEWVEMQKKI